ncbi:MAG TPA: hypothetical protein VEC38_06755 [Candidatus Binataceae bacterium]|nr:hypothetical protein [Candidatus Binataceae bacterium]
MRETAYWSISALAGIGAIVEYTRGEYALVTAIAGALIFALTIAPATRRNLR